MMKDSTVPDEDQQGSAFVATTTLVTFNWEREIALDAKRECYLDLKGNVRTDLKRIDFEELVKSIPTAEEERLRKETEEKAEKERRKNAKTGFWRYIHVLDPMWLVNYSKKDIECMFFNKIMYYEADKEQALRY
ncbi:hypothetical protein Hanom_Chr08g00728181 [Helianthus anomalus]